VSTEEGTPDPSPLNLHTFNRSTVPGLFAIVDRLEHAIGLPPGFYERLVHAEDDWSFVLKLHALMEASITMLLTEWIGGGRVPDSSDLTKVLSRLEMSRTDVGKVQLAFTLGLIGKRDRRLLYFLSALRNDFVHDIKNVSLTLQDHVAPFNQQQMRKFTDTLFINFTEQMIRTTLSYPRRSIWLSSLTVLSHLRIQFEALQVQRRAPGTNRAEWIREMKGLTEDQDRLLQRLKGPEAGSEGESPP
jgi:hypothetical protein